MHVTDGEDNQRGTSGNAVFTLLFAMFIGHELDAVAQHEWRLLYVLRAMPDALAQDIFVLAHVPIVFLLVWLGWHSVERVRSVTRMGCAVFMMVHAGLHWRLREDPLYTFHSATSMFLIFGGLVPAVLLLASDVAQRARSVSKPRACPELVAIFHSCSLRAAALSQSRKDSCTGMSCHDHRS